MALSKTQLRIVNVLHGIQLFLAAGVLGIGIYKMFFVKNRAAASGGRWALSVVSLIHCIPTKTDANFTGGEINDHHLLSGPH